MAASSQSLLHLSSIVPLGVGNLSSGGLQGVSQVCRQEVEVEELSWKMLAD